MYDMLCIGYCFVYIGGYFTDSAITIIFGVLITSTDDVDYLWNLSDGNIVYVEAPIIQEEDFTLSKITSEILSTEYSERFDNIHKDMMIMSYYKYGSLKENYQKFKCMDAVGNIKKRLEKYMETGNTEFLADVANFAMIEFMYPSVEGAKYTPTDSGACETVGFGVNEVRNV